MVDSALLATKLAVVRDAVARIQSVLPSSAVLADHGVLDPALAARMRAAAGLRNPLAHQYGTIDFDRLFELAGERTDDLTAFCMAVAAWIETQPDPVS